MHRYQRAYVSPPAPGNRPLLVQFNSWYPFGQDVDVERLKAAADAAAADEGRAAEAGGAGAGAQPGEGAGDGPGGAAGSGAARDGRSKGPGGPGGGPHGYGTGGVAPQRAESPTALPDAPVNPGKAIEVVLPAFSDAGSDTPGDEPSGTKRKADSPGQARAPRVRQERPTAASESASREPAQRWPNWVFKLLHR
jgi:hypothetical protein